jgi:predicted enzyme related to lactoylglutathione lyase
MLKHSNAFSSFSVDDIQKAKKFYSEVLGLEVKDSLMGLLELHIQGNHPVMIYPKPNHEPATFTVLNFPVDDIEKTIDAFIAKGIVFEQYEGQIKTNEKGISVSPVGPKIAWFKDTAGNIFSIIEKI